MKCCETDNCCDEKNLVASFKALGEPTRLRIFDFLRSCSCAVAVDDSGDVRCADGATVGEVCCQITGVEKITSTISEHLRVMQESGLIDGEKKGRNMVYSVNTDTVSALVSYLASNPADQPEPCC